MDCCAGACWIKPGRSSPPISTIAAHFLQQVSWFHFLRQLLDFSRRVYPSGCSHGRQSSGAPPIRGFHPRSPAGESCKSHARPLCEPKPTNNPSTRMKVQKALTRFGPAWARQNYMGQETAGAIRKAAKLVGLVAVAGPSSASRAPSKGLS